MHQKDLMNDHITKVGNDNIPSINNNNCLPEGHDYTHTDMHTIIEAMESMNEFIPSGSYEWVLHTYN